MYESTLIILGLPDFVAVRDFEHDDTRLLLPPSYLLEASLHLDILLRTARDLNSPMAIHFPWTP
jgi:hypothetical protein